jgi:hypothetical protein
MNYDEYVNKKRIEVKPSGFDVDADALNPKLFNFQAAIVRWAIRRGKAALFEDCGLGKSLQEWEFAQQTIWQTDLPALILAPLSVNKQMVKEAPLFGYTINNCRGQSDVKSGINVANYEILHKFDPDTFGTIICDESSILKGGAFGKISNELVDFAKDIPYRLAATATPAPNDLDELIFHAQFLGIMRESEIKALFFTQDGNSSNKMRLKRNAVQHFYKWLASWAVALRKPSDLGYMDEGFDLPALHINQITVDGSEEFANGMLFQVEAHGISEQRAARKGSIVERVRIVADMVNNSNDQWIVWCDLNDESAALSKAIPDAVEVKGSDKSEHKEDAMLGFGTGKYRVIVSKPSICGFGMNWQQSHKMVFCGLGNSYEQYYQGIRRQYRFGQVNDVDVFVVVSAADGSVVANIRRKELQAAEMFDNLVQHMAVHTDLGAAKREDMEYKPEKKVKVPSFVKKNNQTPTIPGNTWINLDAIPYKWDTAPEFNCGVLVGNQAIVKPEWIQSVI